MAAQSKHCRHSAGPHRHPATATRTLTGFIFLLISQPATSLHHVVTMLQLLLLSHLAVQYSYTFVVQLALNATLQAGCWITQLLASTSPDQPHSMHLCHDAGIVLDHNATHPTELPSHQS